MPAASRPSSIRQTILAFSRFPITSACATSRRISFPEAGLAIIPTIDISNSSKKNRVSHNSPGYPSYLIAGSCRNAVQYVVYRGDNVSFIGQHVILKNRAERDRDIFGCYPRDGPVKVFQGLFGYDGSYFTGDGALAPGFLYNYQVPGFLNRFEHRFMVNGINGAQINDFTIDTLFG